MQAFVTTIFALLLVIGAHSPVPASGAVARSGASSIVWIARETIHECEAAVPPVAQSSPGEPSIYQSIVAPRHPESSLFQRPPPSAL